MTRYKGRFCSRSHELWVRNQNGLYCAKVGYSSHLPVYINFVKPSSHRRNISPVLAVPEGRFFYAWDNRWRLQKDCQQDRVRRLSQNESTSSMTTGTATVGKKRQHTGFKYEHEPARYICARDLCSIFIIASAAQYTAKVCCGRSLWEALR